MMRVDRAGGIMPNRKGRRRSGGGSSRGVMSFIPKPIRRWVPGVLIVAVAIFLISVFSEEVEKAVTWMRGLFKKSEESGSGGTGGEA